MTAAGGGQAQTQGSKGPAQGQAGAGERQIRLPTAGEKDGAFALRGFRERYVVTRWIYLRMLGLLLVVTFVSSALQLGPLVGDSGLAPASTLLQQAHDVASRKGALEGIRVFPSLLWILPGDLGLSILSWAGAGAAGLMVAGFYPGPALLFAWVAYLSLCVAGGVFFDTAWDGLLLETLLLSLFWAPWQKNPGFQATRPPSRDGRLLLKYLILKVFFLSALSRLLSSEPHWENLSALELYTVTQYLPTSGAWLVNALPSSVKVALTAVIYGIELLFPWLMWLGRPLRMAAFWGFSGLMAFLAFTGNHGFFPVLLFTLGLVLLDDEALLGLMPSALRSWVVARVEAELSPGARVPRVPMIVARVGEYLAFCVIAMVVLAGASDAWTRATAKPPPGPLRDVVRWIEASRSINAYHFMDEIREKQRVVVIEASVDGKTFHEWPIAWIPGQTTARPGFLPWIVPRLALEVAEAADRGSCGSARWYLPLVRGLAAGDAQAVGLMGPNPFPDATPTVVRSYLYDYSFANGEGGEWWTRARGVRFCGPVQARKGSASGARGDVLLEDAATPEASSPPPAQESPRSEQPGARKKKRASSGSREGATGFER